MSIISGANAVTGAGAVSYQIERSLRFNSADSAYLSRTPGSTTSSTKATFSFWVKASKTVNGTTNPGTIVGRMSGSYNFVQFWDQNNNGNPVWYFGNTSVWMNTASVVRDYSAWYHVVCILDTTQATDSNRLQIWVNGVRQTAGGFTTYPALNSTQEFLNSSSATYYIGQNGNGGAYLNSYLAEIYFIDGQALDPTSFGEYNSDTGVWQPKAYTGSYGTNGFYLDFADNSSTTALGYDAAGSNDWTPNNFSVTAGAGNDSLVDTPTPYGTDTGVGGEVRGNYATWNPLKFYSTTVPTLNNGNLQAAWNNTSMFCGSTIACLNGSKTYSEFTLDTANTTRIGIKLSSDQGQYTGGWTYIADSGVIRNTSDTNVQTGLSTSGNGTVIGIAVDLVANTLQFYRNGSTLGTSISIANASDWLFWVGQNGSGSSIAVTANFGQRPFAYTAPSGFKALCTQNLPEPTVVDGADYFNAVLYTGNAATNTITTGFAPDLVWIKDRVFASGADHFLFDKLRTTYSLSSNTTGAETQKNNDGFTSLDNTGFTLNGNGGGDNINRNASSFVAWNWKAGGTGVTNTAGTITSTVSANTTAGFSIATYTGNGSVGETFGHGLGVAPSMVIVKWRDGADDWCVYNKNLTTSRSLWLNSTSAQLSSAYFGYFWNNTDPTSTVVTLGSNGAVNGSGRTYVAYCFAPVAGYSAFGNYTGNGSTDGVFVYTGFAPRYILIKNASYAGTSWEIFDTARQNYNQNNLELLANTSGAEGSYNFGDILSNGFKLRSSNNGVNRSGDTLIYAAFAENPFKYSLAR